MTNTQPLLARRAGLACLAGAALTITGSVAAAVADATGNVADELFRAPFSHDAFLAFSAYGALAHLAILLGVIGLRRTGLAGPAAASRAGLSAVAAGTALLFACEWASLPIADHRDSSTAAGIVIAGFGVATLLVTFGMVAAGIGARATGRLDGWRRNAPLACGLLSLIVIGVQFTPLLWLGVAIYGLGYAVLGLALTTAPTRRDGHAVGVAAPIELAPQ